MSEREQRGTQGEQTTASGLGNPFAMGGLGDGVRVDHGVYGEDLPLAGRSVGEIRRIVGSRFDLGPRSAATLDGNPVDEDTVVQAGQQLRFMHDAGEKGENLSGWDSLLGAALHGTEALRRRRLGVAMAAPAVPKVTVEGERVCHTSPEGTQASMKLAELIDLLLGKNGANPRDTQDLLLPDGVRWATSRGGTTVLVHQTPPAVHNLKWIAKDSPERHGDGTTYRRVKIALPYVVIFAVFESQRDGKLRLSDANQCFFRTEPLRSPDDELSYPALLNCSKFDSPNRPDSWICTQFLRRKRLPARTGDNERVRQGMCDLLRCMFDTGFNYSSEEHEVSSWFTESRKVDPRISTIECWEEATRRDPLFVGTVPWIPVGKSVRKVAESILSRHGGPPDRPRTSREIVRLLHRHGVVKAAKTSAGGEA